MIYKYIKNLYELKCQEASKYSTYIQKCSHKNVHTKNMMKRMSVLFCRQKWCYVDLHIQLKWIKTRLSRSANAYKYCPKNIMKGMSVQFCRQTMLSCEACWTKHYSRNHKNAYNWLTDVNSISRLVFLFEKWIPLTTLYITVSAGRLVLYILFSQLP